MLQLSQGGAWFYRRKVPMRTIRRCIKQRRFFSHETPDGLRMNDRALSFGIAHFKILAENIAINQGFDDPGALAVEQWLLSPGHRANILDPRFEQSAVGVSVGADGTVYLTQEFIAR